MNKEEKDRIIKNYISPDATVEYLLIEKTDNQYKVINDDQGYQMGFFNLFFTGTAKNYELATFKKELTEELNYSVKTYDTFKNNNFILKDYKFGFVDNDKNIKVFHEMDGRFFEYLRISLRNLLIVGKNFDIENFKHHKIFNHWFDEYTNRY